MLVPELRVALRVDAEPAVFHVTVHRLLQVQHEAVAEHVLEAVELRHLVGHAVGGHEHFARVDRRDGRVQVGPELRAAGHGRHGAPEHARARRQHGDRPLHERKRGGGAAD